MLYDRGNVHLTKFRVDQHEQISRGNNGDRFDILTTPAIYTPDHLQGIADPQERGPIPSHAVPSHAIPTLLNHERFAAGGRVLEAEKKDGSTT